MAENDPPNDAPNNEEEDNKKPKRRSWTIQILIVIFLVFLLTALIVAVIILCFYMPRTQSEMINWYLHVKSVSIDSDSSQSDTSKKFSMISGSKDAESNNYFANKFVSNVQGMNTFVTRNYHHFLRTTKVPVCPESASRAFDYSMGKFKSAAISTDAAQCATIGTDILTKDGSAVDAAIAVLLCMGVVNPQSSGLGGGFLMLYYNRTAGISNFIDAREAIPLKATLPMFKGIALLKREPGMAIAVPGEIKGYEEAHKMFGSLTWEELFEPTITMCNNGITVTPHLARALERKKRDLKDFEPFEEIFTNGTGEVVYKSGDVYTRPDLAKTLEYIAENKSAAIYDPESPLAQGLLADLKEKGSILDQDDLRNYTSVLRDPIKKTLKNNITLHSASFPGSGALLAFVLGVLGAYDDIKPEVFNTREDTVRNLHRMIEAFKFAFAHRMKFEDSLTEDMKELEKQLVSDDYAQEVQLKINDTNTNNNLEHYGVNITYQFVNEEPGAAQVSIIAPNGDAVSVTSTINSDFGSMVLSPSTGILFNNQMAAFFSSNISNTVQPGERIFSSMTPAIVTDAKGDVIMTIGGNGGKHITTSLAQLIMRTLFLEQDFREAVGAPRLHQQLFPNVTDYEEAFDQAYLQGLIKMGHNARLRCGRLGNVVGVIREGQDDLYAISDYGKGGSVAGLP